MLIDRDQKLSGINGVHYRMTSIATVVRKDEKKQAGLTADVGREKKINGNLERHVIPAQPENYKNVEPPTPIRHTDISRQQIKSHKLQFRNFQHIFSSYRFRSSCRVFSTN